MSTGKKWLVAILLPILLACFGMDMWGIYYYMFLKDNFTLTTAYVDDMTYSGEEQKFFIEAQYYPNMAEFKFNYYTDSAVPEFNEDTQSYGEKYTFTSGVQFDGGYSAKVKTRKTGFSDLGAWFKYNELTNCTYYNLDQQGNAFEATMELENQDKWVYDIGGQLVLIKEKGNVKYDSNGLGYGRYRVYDVSLMLQDLYNSIASLEDGKRVVTFDLSEYFTFTLYNETTGRFEEEIHETKETWMYVNVYVEKYSTDFVEAEQSWFGQFMGDNEWTLYDLEKAEYWRARNEFNIGISDFTFTYQNGGYYLKLQQGVVDFLSNFDNMKINVSIDLDNIYLGSETIKFKGFTDKAFGSLGIDTINLTTTETCEFVVHGNYNIVCPDNLTILNLEVQNV